MSDSKTRTKDPGPFNDITLMILIFLGSVAVIGLWLAYNAATVGSRIWGVVFIGCAGAMFAIGLKDHSASKPKQAGLITVWGRPQKNIYVVTGQAVLLPFFPFYIDTVVIDVEDKDHAFKEDDFVFQTRDGIQMKIEVSISGCPDIYDLIDYNQAGADFKQAVERFREVVIVELQELAKTKDALDIKKESKTISAALKEALETKIAERIETEGASIGFYIKTVQVVPIIPAELASKMNNVVEERFEGQAESIDYDAAMTAAKSMQFEVAKQYIPALTDMDERQKAAALAKLINDGKIQDLNTYVERIKDLKLIKQGKAVGVRNTGGGKALSVTNVDTSTRQS